MEKRDVKSSRDILIHSDCLAENVDYTNVKMIVLPGGRIGTANLAKSMLVKQKCVEFAKDKYVAAICAAPSIFAESGLFDGKLATCHPDFENQMMGAALTHEGVTVADNIITAQGLGAAFEFAFELVNILVGEDITDKIKKAICYEG